MSLYPYNSKLGQRLQSELATENDGRGFVKHLELTALEGATADTDGVMAALQDDGAEAVVTAGLTAPPYPRNITATATGGADDTDIGAIQVIVEGTNYLDEAISETLPAFTANTAGTVAGALAFKTVTQVTIPAHDGTDVTTAIGFGDIYGLPDNLSLDTVLAAYVDGSRESTLPTVTADADDIESNTVDFGTAPADDTADLYYIV